MHDERNKKLNKKLQRIKTKLLSERETANG